MSSYHSISHFAVMRAASDMQLYTRLRIAATQIQERWSVDEGGAKPWYKSECIAIKQARVQHLLSREVIANFLEIRKH